MNTVHAYGDRALLVTELDEPAAFAAAIHTAELPILDVATGADSVMVVLASPADAAPVWAALSRLSSTATATTSNELVEINVQYDGDDLEDVAFLTGMSVESIVELHTSTEFTVAFCGFAPGFAYLTGLPAELHVPRLATPRTAVPAGSVAIAAEFSGVYPRTSPGGWRLIGRTNADLFDVQRDPPALLTPGDRVRFIAT